MIKKFIKGKTYVFIDAANILYSQHTLGWNISYERLMAYFKKECQQLGMCFVFIGRFSSTNKQNKFFDMLDINGYKVVSKPVKKIKISPDVSVNKADLDVEMSFEIYERAKEYDTAILLTGDSDFAYVVERIKKQEKRVIVMSTRGHISSELLSLAKYIDFRKLKKEISLNKNPRKNRGNLDLSAKRIT
jgi:uncharacterized LabA/DUF88 family protein